MAGKDEELKIRVPASLKTAVRALADSRLTSESAIVREAVLEYVARHKTANPTPAEPPQVRPTKEIGAEIVSKLVARRKAKHHAKNQ